ncbi:MAG TPA: sulfatase [Verrucomicrobiae bacterium]|nr:sulfatase [Verrucomicrobiae bacterium]
MLSCFAERARSDEPAPARPNIVFILCDDLGINDLHCYGRKDHHTPNLDRLASEGIRFTSAYCAQPICSASRAAILTGIAPARSHLTTYLPGRKDCSSQKLLQAEIETQVPLSVKMLPNYFKAAGYVCGAFGKWHVGGKGFGPLEHGFDVYHAGKSVTKPSDHEGGKGEYDLTQAAENFIETNRNRPFLVYLAHYSPHIPYTAQQWRIAANKGAFEPVYAGVIETLDDTVGRLLTRLDQLGLSKSTIVVFTSDNGGLHVPEGPHPRITYNAPFRAGKGYVYEGGLRIPLIVRWTGHIRAGKITDTPVVNSGWIPTLLELAGLPAPSGLDGVSFAGLLLNQRGLPQRPLFWHFPHYTNQGSRPSGAMRDDKWMYVEYYDDEDRKELYDLSKDPGERRNLAAQEASRTARMHEALQAWRNRVSANENRPNPDFDPDKFRELYIDVDPGSFDPLRATKSEWEQMWSWRKEMNAAVRHR